MNRFDVLFVDDDQITIDSAVFHLKLRGKTVMTAYSALDALEMLEGAQFDFIFLDVMMGPGEAFSLSETADGRYTGLRLLEKVKTDDSFRHNFASKYFLITNWRNEPQVDEVARRLSATVLRKPLSIEAIDGCVC